MPAKKKVTKKRVMGEPPPVVVAVRSVSAQITEELVAIGDAWSTIRAITVRESSRLGE